MKKLLLSFFIVMMSIISVNAQLTESFDAATFPPVGWLNLPTIGTTPASLWERGAAGDFGGDIDATTTFTVDPHSGAGMAKFRSYDFATGTGAHLITSAVNLTTGGPHLISFWMYRDNTYPNPDSVSVYVNTTQSATGALFLGKILRRRTLAPAETGPNGWYQYSFNIPAGFNTANNYFIFSAVGRFGNNMFIDDITVATQPACNVPTAITTTNFNYTAGTITANWTAPAIGTPVGYQWATNTTGVAPASGTAVTGTTANITGITTGVVNYIYVRTNCGIGNFSAWVSSAFASLPCVTLTAPANAATNQPQTVAFSWDALTGANSYNVFLGGTALTLVNLGNTTATTVNVSGLFPSQTYFWNIIPVISGVARPTSGCTPNSFTVGAESTTPPNNPCIGAININAGNTIANPINSTTTDATISLPASACLGFTGTPDDDVWFEFTTSASAPSGTLTITPTVAGGIFDIVAQVYAATSCAGLGTAVTCADGTIDDAPEVLNLSPLAPNTHYFMRVYSWSDDPNDQGAFTIVASAGNTLPVSLASFEARRSNGVNMLTWSTTQEINTSHFSIERSSDGRGFESIGEVAAAGNSNRVLNYSFTDIHPLKGNNYYRLRTVDKDNSSKLSDTRRIRNDGVADVSIYPNPVTDKLRVSINSDKATNGNLVITDLSGKAVYTMPVKLPQGNIILPVALNNLAAGSYILKIQLNDDVILKRFNKQ
ncbi:MAG: T9SS type A sorting domain-containing protein [Ferruginibacter sp.]|nr:T9SS type A sorting domain-containing protein [Ferruginibacter sp.]